MLRTTVGKQISVLTRSLLKRCLATTAGAGANIEVTELPNGLTVATEYVPHSKVTSTGIVFPSGSTAEDPYNNGVANILTKNFLNNPHIIVEAAKDGFQLISNVNRESQSFVVNSAQGQPSKILNFLQSKVLSKDFKSLEKHFDTIRSKAVDEAAFFEENDHQNRAMEHLHSTAFQNTPLSLPTRGTVETLQTLVTDDVASFANKTCNIKDAVIVATGNTSHADLVKAVEKEIDLNQTSKNALIKPKSSFLGSEVRLRDDTLPKAWVAIAAEGESAKSEQYLTSHVATSIFGEYFAMEPRSRLQGIKLLDNLQEYQLCDSFTHFNLNYKDSGLWGFTTMTGNIGNIDDLIHFTLKQWNRLSISITETELERGKALLKLKLATDALKRKTNAALLANEILANDGVYLNLDEVFKKIHAVTIKDIKNWAGNKLWDQDIAISGVGQIEDLLDYMRMRNDMSMMRW
ncbi:hypothetical protein KAFR_0B00620 [Kazachstania africana CBS 2517]|uniref:Peptidase M16 C-terminal domain-containing protein n=1 Tax=Kazachstania africana (strain ATCC 22294 / BCRC 22015 / CBS 2517 / CECT 1963 / NBRC 1671 / NRRL Y-8276) TaxID=1071382 RepID=H2APR1_KAZAF|nr:hypothetical protein KAFR_0B00620 [Kazachstania africana CBS 2517]CCF56361.1 hypothetical protein KAFR_0B00620 [Kazachstania africana CBS 2517]